MDLSCGDGSSFVPQKADSYIHIDVEFGEGEGKIPVDSIAKRAEAQAQRKSDLQNDYEYIEAKYGCQGTYRIYAEVKAKFGIADVRCS